MANPCMDFVSFFAENEEQKAGIGRLASDFSACYPGRRTEETDLGRILRETGIDLLTPDYMAYYPEERTGEADFSRFLKTAGIPAEELHLRGAVILYGTDGESFIWMGNDAVWVPMYGAYKAIAEHYGVKFVMRSEEPGASIYVNTDTDGTYFADRYKVWMWNRLDDGFLDAVYEAMEGKEEAYFGSEEAMLEWFRKGGIDACSLEELRSETKRKGISIEEFDDSYAEE